MASNNRDKEIYSKRFPEMNKWLNECMVCHTIGYKPELPQNIYPGALAENIRDLYNVLPVNEISICKDCESYLNKK